MRTRVFASHSLVALSACLGLGLTQSAAACSVQSIRLGGQPGDAYIGPTCNNDQTHRTCFYVNGTNLPEPAGAYYQIRIEGFLVATAFQSRISTSQAVVCASGMPDGADFDVQITLAAGCGRIAPDLYTPPVCGCVAHSIRLGGQTGDSYIGRTCNADGTYRTCFYVGGQNLADPIAPYYLLQLNGVSTPVALQARENAQSAVVCATNLSPYEGPVSVRAELTPRCNASAVQLYNSSEQCSCLTTPGAVAACMGGPGIFSNGFEATSP
jgi:hypothetical protein